MTRLGDHIVPATSVVTGASPNQTLTITLAGTESVTIYRISAHDIQIVVNTGTGYTTVSDADMSSISDADFFTPTGAGGTLTGTLNVAGQSGGDTVTLSDNTVGFNMIETAGDGDGSDTFKNLIGNKPLNGTITTVPRFEGKTLS